MKRELLLAVVATASTSVPVLAGLPAGTRALELRNPWSDVLETWWVEPQLRAITDEGEVELVAREAAWSSSEPGVATFDAGKNRIVAHAAGVTTLEARLGGLVAELEFVVHAPALPPVWEDVAPYLATPAAGHLWEVPVLIIRYLPTTDGINLDVTKNPGFWTPDPLTLEETIGRIETFDRRIKFGVEEGSRFRAYGHATPPPSLGIRVVDYITVYEQTPPSSTFSPDGVGYFVDYHSMFARFDLEHYVEDLGVREVWFWQAGLGAEFPTFDPTVHRLEDTRSVPESNMASPTTGDVSNSHYAPDDLPVYDRTYVVYGQAIRRTQAEALHNRGHQLERVLQHANRLQDGNVDLFWRDFVGYESGAPGAMFSTGRCGWTHSPPNTTIEYDYTNPAVVESDIEDWRPDGTGERKPVSAATWGERVYPWPDGVEEFPQRVETQWYIYWFQSMPGQDNLIPHPAGATMTNWWEFTARWDEAIVAGLGLYDPVRPDNDDAARAQGIAGASGTALGTNRGATDGADDLQVLGSRSVWWQWSAPFEGELEVTTRGSTFDTTLTIFGWDRSLGAWHRLVENDDDGGGLQSRATVAVASGTDYLIAVAGYSAAEGDVQLHWSSRADGVTASDAQIPNVPASVVDGTLETRWSARGDGQWLRFDLGEGPWIVAGVAIAWYNGDRRQAHFRIETSLDGEAWSVGFDGDSSGTTRELEAYGFGPTLARYVRIVGRGTTEGEWNSITLVNIAYEGLPGPFRRGDCQGDGFVDISDVVTLLEFAFLGTKPPSCLAACDFDGTGQLDVTTALALLGSLFGGNGPLPPPSSMCGRGRLEDAELGCRISPSMCENERESTSEKAP